MLERRLCYGTLNQHLTLSCLASPHLYLQFQDTGIAQTVLRIGPLGLNSVTAAGLVSEWALPGGCWYL
jgi:hypothetical protein